MYDYFMEKFVYQMFILGTGEEKLLDFALQKGLGGVIFFSRDIKTEQQFKILISDIKSKALTPPFLAIDQEGGRVERTENLHERYISPKFAFQRGEEFLKHQTELIAKELKNYGINLNFAPCADVNTNPNNPIIGERAFSDNEEDVIKGVRLVSQIYREHGIIPCIKHYPGHGDANKDSHLTLPIIDLPLSKMEQIHIKPFQENINIEMIMAAHLHCTCFDKEVIPASLSKNAIGYLRTQLNYKGVIITDDMVMKGVQDFGSLEACEKAILAGVDMFIFRDTTQEVVEMITQLTKHAEKNELLKNRIFQSYERIKTLKQHYSS